MASPPPRATLIEVAQLAGTSKTSVSRFFGPERHKLSAVLQQRIAEAAETLGYFPNQMARGLKGGSSALLGMLVADIRNPFSVAILYGVEQAARHYGYSLIVCNTNNDPASEQQHLASLAAYQVEGLIINAAGQPEQQLQAMRRSGMPLVLVDRDIHQLNADVIGLDNALAIDMALDHLAQQGYQSVLYVSEAPKQASSRQQRLLRFRQKTEALGLESQTLMLSHWEPQSTDTQLAEFLKHHSTSPPAVLCANGNATLSMAHSFRRLGLAMGSVGLIGIDELDWCELISPGITTLAQPTDSIGHDSVVCLLNQLARNTQALPFQYRHPPRLRVRGSTTP